MSSFFDSYFSTEVVRPKQVISQLDFTIDSKDFIEWLKKTGEDVFGDTYSKVVSSMCEYSCLYIAKILEGVKLKGELKFCLGDYSCWEHYWASYTLNGVEYFVDLTLAQFDPQAPEFSIVLSSNSVHKTAYNNYVYISFNEFIDARRRDLDIIEQDKAIEMKNWFNQPNPFDNFLFNLNSDL